MRFRFLIPLTLALALCAQGQPPHTPGAGINFYKLDREIALGAALAEDVRRESQVLDSELVQAYVARLGRQLALQTAGPNFPYAFTAVADLPPGVMTNNPTHEPMAVPGGPIFIPAGLILEAQSTAELAGMLAHAIAHVADRDCTRSETRADLMQVSASTAPQFRGCWSGEPVAPGSIQFQHAFERQADYLAVQTMSKAGYDPAALAAYIRRVKPDPKRASSPPRAFSPWPTAEERLKQIEHEIGTLPPDRPYSAGEDIAPIQLALRSLAAK